MATQQAASPKKNPLLLQQHEVGCYQEIRKELAGAWKEQFIIRYHGRADRNKPRTPIPVLALIRKRHVSQKYSWGVLNSCLKFLIRLWNLTCLSLLYLQVSSNVGFEIGETSIELAAACWGGQDVATVQRNCFEDGEESPLSQAHLSCFWVGVGGWRRSRFQFGSGGQVLETSSSFLVVLFFVVFFLVSSLVVLEFVLR
jgi:hypothetical protein